MHLEELCQLHVHRQPRAGRAHGKPAAIEGPPVVPSQSHCGFALRWPRLRGWLCRARLGALRWKRAYDAVLRCACYNFKGRQSWLASWFHWSRPQRPLELSSPG
eukprot:168137-Chlamydomonas_euryale.AAC.8